ncbi:GDP-fucose protein O-fucosyltransferase [Artemisia annua]|uniref:GDP-fucose protein O-fucosyltransferase n=1 Tax=Artemisia annua TaxID=35608 RepID=A0A2U1QN68_ARTAN|nr:GDP-fucose protein O-fucosyltransferase [Artemisia annua]
MNIGRGEFREYPSTCICKKPFKFSGLDSNYNGNQTLSKYSFNPEAETGYGSNEEDQGVHNVQRIEDASMIRDHGSSPKESKACV